MKNDDDDDDDDDDNDVDETGWLYVCFEKLSL